MKYAHSCANCNAVKIRVWQRFDVTDEWIENDDNDCEHEWEDGVVI